VGENKPNDSRAETVGQTLSRSRVDTFRITNSMSELEKIETNQIKPKGAQCSVVISFKFGPVVTV
jgi:hypothetical protein